MTAFQLKSPGEAEVKARRAVAQATRLPPSALGESMPRGFSPCLPWRVDRSTQLFGEVIIAKAQRARDITLYRGCALGCAYCPGRTHHQALGHDMALDFERELYANTHALTRFQKAVSEVEYQVVPIVLGRYADVYQPLERSLRLTRGLLEMALHMRHPLSIICKSDLILRDLDVLSELAKLQLLQVAVSLTTLNHDLAARMEPAAPSPSSRLHSLEKLNSAGIPCVLRLAPMVPALNCNEIEALVQAGADAGARYAKLGFLRLPMALRPHFANWLQTHYPYRKSRVLNGLVDGPSNGPNDGAGCIEPHSREQNPIKRRFEQACEASGLHDAAKCPKLRCDLFCKALDARQIPLL